MYLAVTIGTKFFTNGGRIATVFGGSDLTGVGTIVSFFLRGAFFLAVIILLFYFLSAGVAMIGSAGKNDPKSQEQAKATITSALIGFIVVFAAYWIVKLIGTLLKIPNII